MTALNSVAWSPGSRIQDNLNFMPDSMFMQSGYLDKLIVGPNVETIGSHSIERCINLKNLYALPLDPPKFTNVDRRYLFEDWAIKVSLNLPWNCKKEFELAYGVEQWMPLYWKKYGWKEFLNWLYWDYNPGYYESMGGMGDITSDGGKGFGIHREGDNLVLSGIADNEPVRVYDLTGRLVTQTCGSRITILSRGMYVIATRGGSYKIAF